MVPETDAFPFRNDKSTMVGACRAQFLNSPRSVNAWRRAMCICSFSSSSARRSFRSTMFCPAAKRCTSAYAAYHLEMQWHQITRDLGCSNDDDTIPIFHTFQAKLIHPSASPRHCLCRAKLEAFNLNLLLIISIILYSSLFIVVSSREACCIWDAVISALTST